MSSFKMTMKAYAAACMEPPLDKNPASKLWQKLGCNGLLLSKLSKFMKLSEIAIMPVLGNCEDEQTFSNSGLCQKQSLEPLRWSFGHNCETLFIGVLYS